MTVKNKDHTREDVVNVSTGMSTRMKEAIRSLSHSGQETDMLRDDDAAYSAEYGDTYQYPASSLHHTASRLLPACDV